ncbi:MAG: ATP-binding protein [Thiohalomonadales bacterium]
MKALRFKLSLKYRIAIVFFVVAGMMMGIVLTMTLAKLYVVNKQHLEINESVITKQIEDLCRIALFTHQFDDLIPFMAQSIENSITDKVLMADRRGIVVASSDVTDIGLLLADISTPKEDNWQVTPLQNASGRLGTLLIKFTEKQLLQANREALTMGFTAASFAIIIIAIVGILMGHFLTRRLAVLSNVAARLAEGELEVRANLSGTDEIALVGSTFDHMAESIASFINEIHQSEARLKKAHGELEYRVEQRTNELAIARDDALEASQAKSKFLASMSHELRTPLNAIIGYSELLLEEAIDNGEGVLEMDLNKINSAGTHLLGLIDDILDLSRIEAGKMSLMLAWFEVESCIKEVLTSLYPLLKKTGNTIKLLYGEDLGSMYADKIKVRQILINLIFNAAKFSPDSEIQIELSRIDENGNDYFVFSVADQGVGIHPDKIQELFSEFTQLTPVKCSIQKGTGLGLAISQKYCNFMGGYISVTSEVGLGSTFSVKLPVEVSEQKAA